MTFPANTTFVPGVNPVPRMSPETANELLVAARTFLAGVYPGWSVEAIRAKAPDAEAFLALRDAIRKAEWGL
jgi:hypothetical protein